MPGRGSYGPSGKWIHDRANRIMEKGDVQGRYGDKGKSVAYAIATQQAHKMGKTPKKGAGPGGTYGTREGKTMAKEKYPLSKNEYRKTAAHRVLEKLALSALVRHLGRTGSFDKEAKLPSYLRNLARSGKKLEGRGRAYASSRLSAHEAGRGAAKELKSDPGWAKGIIEAGKKAKGRAAERLKEVRTVGPHWMKDGGAMKMPARLQRARPYQDTPHAAAKSKKKLEDLIARRKIIKAGEEMSKPLRVPMMKTSMSLQAARELKERLVRVLEKVASLAGQDLRKPFSGMKTNFPTKDSTSFANKSLKQSQNIAKVGPTANKLTPKGPSVSQIAPTSGVSMPKIGAVMNKFAADPLVQYLKKEAAQVQDNLEDLPIDKNVEAPLLAEDPSPSKGVITKALADCKTCVGDLFSHSADARKKYTQKEK